MKKSKSSTRSGTSNKRKDPFAVPPNPFGFAFLEERPRLRATQFGSILPSVIAKYGIGRRLGVERFVEAWNESLEVVFGGEWEDDSERDFDVPSLLETFRAKTKLLSFRAGILRVEVASNLLANELQFRTPQLLSEMRGRLPNETIERLKLVIR